MAVTTPRLTVISPQLAEQVITLFGTPSSFSGSLNYDADPLRKLKTPEELKSLEKYVAEKSGADNVYATVQYQVGKINVTIHYSDMFLDRPVRELTVDIDNFGDKPGPVFNQVRGLLAQARTEGFRIKRRYFKSYL